MGTPVPRLWTIPPSAAFLERLADALIAGALVPPQADGAAWPLADHLVLLPTRRSCRALAAILAERAGGAALLPRIRPIGDVDEVELALAGAGALGDHAMALDLPPAIAPLRRHVLLTRLVLTWGRTIATSLMVPGRDEPVAIPVVPGDAAYLARDLSTLIDDFETEGSDFSRLGELVPDEYARYWQITVAFLSIVTELWPQVLADEGAVDPAARRNALLKAEAARLAASPPHGPVIAAGSTGTIPATAALLAAIARLPHGAVVLPGLDLDLDEESWAALDDEERPHAGHPQYGLKRLLVRLGAVRQGVEALVAPALPARERIVSEAFRPVATTDRWASLAERIGAADLDRALDGVSVIEATGEQEEAVAIAIAMREAVETPERTVALVTPDRGLARRVAAELRRWDIEIADSAGVPLAETAAGTLLRLIADAAALRLAPVALVALMQHPLAAFAMVPAEARRAGRLVELIALRGPRPKPGGAGLVATLRHMRARGGSDRPHPAVERLDEADWEAAIALAGQVAAALAPLETLAGAGERPLAEIVAAHRRALDMVASTPEGTTLTGEDDQGIEAFLDDLGDAGGSGPAARLEEYPALLRALMAGTAARPRAPGHPRLSILGPLEARLISADLVILGGLEEGVWPAATRTDAFLNRPMRRDIGLEPPERFTGLAAHDVAQAMCAGEVILAHTTKAGGAPAVPSRWLQRLKTVAGEVRYKRLVARGGRYLALCRGIDRWPGPTEPAGEPAPRPPLEARPRRISVTEVETLIRDPYSLYARRILRLEPLAGLDEAPDAARRGNLIHDALGVYVQAVDAGEPADLIAIGARLFVVLDDFPEVRAFWWPRFRRVAEWFARHDAADRAGASRRLVEQSGRLELDIVGGEVLLTCRADRIDVTGDGRLRIVDYKTGTAPSPPQVMSGLSPQLPLEAAMAMKGGFGEGLAGCEPGALVYVELKGTRVAGAEKPVVPKEGTIADLAEHMLSSLETLLTRFADPEQPYHVKPRAQFARAVTDYDHLSRWPEWGRLGGGEVGGGE